MAHGAHFRFETRPMIDFQIGNELYGGPFRYLGRWAILLTQASRAVGIGISPTQTFFAGFERGAGGDVMQISIFKEKVSLQESNIFEGDDLNENGNLTNGKYVHMIGF